MKRLTLSSARGVRRGVANIRGTASTDVYDHRSRSPRVPFSPTRRYRILQSRVCQDRTWSVPSLPLFIHPRQIKTTNERFLPSFKFGLFAFLRHHTRPSYFPIISRRTLALKASMLVSPPALIGGVNAAGFASNFDRPIHNAKQTTAEMPTRTPQRNEIICSSHTAQVEAARRNCKTAGRNLCEGARAMNETISASSLLGHLQSRPFSSAATRPNSVDFTLVWKLVACG